MEIKITQNTQANTLNTGLGSPASSGGAGKPLPSVLSGAGVAIKSATDFEKLLAELELQRDEQKEKIAQGQFSAALSVLAGRYGAASESQQKALSGVVAKSAALEQAVADVRAQKSGLSSASSLLQLEIEKLDRLIEAQLKTPEERLAEIKVKELEAEELKTEEIEAEEVAAEEGEEIAGEKASDAESEEVTAQRQKIASLTEGLEQKKLALTSAETLARNAQDDFARSATALGAAARLVIDAVQLTGWLVAATAAEQPDGKPVEEKANAIVAALGEYADKIEEMREEELAEKIAKVASDIAFLAEARTLLAPGDLPEYEQKI